MDRHHYHNHKRKDKYFASQPNIIIATLTQTFLVTNISTIAAASGQKAGEFNVLLQTRIIKMARAPILSYQTAVTTQIIGKMITLFARIHGTHTVAET